MADGVLGLELTEKVIDRQVGGLVSRKMPAWQADGELMCLCGRSVQHRMR